MVCRKGEVVNRVPISFFFSTPNCKKLKMSINVFDEYLLKMIDDMIFFSSCENFKNCIPKKNEIFLMMRKVSTRWFFFGAFFSCEIRTVYILKHKKKRFFLKKSVNKLRRRNISVNT